MSMFYTLLLAHDVSNDVDRTLGSMTIPLQQFIKHDGVRDNSEGMFFVAVTLGTNAIWASLLERFAVVLSAVLMET